MVTGWHEPQAPELKDRLMPKAPPRKPGDIKFNFCPRCHVPLEISQFKWDLEKGTITHEPTNLRYAIFGPAGLQAVFDELERELGDTITGTIIEAQRMHAELRMSEWWSSLATGDLRNWLAVQGMGNLVSLEAVEGGFTSRIENPAVPLVLIGTAIALFEYMFKSKTTLEWSMAENGDLLVTIKRKAQ
jgi:hypothetical protein